MAWKNYVAFGAGEISPEIYERGNLDKFRTGLATLRNAHVTKMGGLRGRPGTAYHSETNLNNKAKYMFVEHKGKLFEFTTGHLRIYSNYSLANESFSTVNNVTVNTTTFPAFLHTDISHFAFNENYMYMFTDGYETLRIDLTTHTIVVLATNNPPWTSIFFGSSLINTAVSAPSGYDVFYAGTMVFNGVETISSALSPIAKIPTGGAQQNNLVFKITKAAVPNQSDLPELVKFYRRPDKSGAFGFIGSTGLTGQNATEWFFEFNDVGGAADFSDRPPTFQSDYAADTAVPGSVSSIKSRTGFIFQDRLILSGTRNKNWLLASRTGSTGLFYRDYPLQADSALAFKNGSNGGAFVKRLLDARGLMVFTNVGVYETPEVLTPETAYSTKRSNFVIDDAVPPVMIGDYVFFYDNRINAIIGMSINDAGGWNSDESSIFSAHLFQGKRVTSAITQTDETQLLWLTLNDGTLLSFSFQNEQQLRSWARHDTDGFAEQVVVVRGPDGIERLFVQVLRNERRVLERLTSLRADVMNYVGSDSSKLYKNNLFKNTHLMLLKPGATPEDPWIIENSQEDFANTPGLGAVDSVFRIFRDDGFAIDLKVVTYSNVFEVEVVFLDDQNPYTFFGVEEDVIQIELNNLYQTWNVFTGLNHLEGKKVTVRLDGFTHASPLNTVNPYEGDYTVDGGQITLINGLRGAIVSIGLPYAQDVVTLEVDTAEQSPTKEKAMICNRMYLSYYKSHEVYTNHHLPADDTVTGMYKETYQVEPDDGIVIKAPPLITERREVITEGDWKAKGSVALRNVDPQPFGLRGIFLDLEVRGR